MERNSGEQGTCREISSLKTRGHRKGLDLPGLFSCGSESFWLAFPIIFIANTERFQSPEGFLWVLVTVAVWVAVGWTRFEMRCCSWYSSWQCIRACTSLRSCKMPWWPQWQLYKGWEKAFWCDFCHGNPGRLKRSAVLWVYWLSAAWLLHRVGGGEKANNNKYPTLSIFLIATIFIHFSQSQQSVLPKMLLLMNMNGASLPTSI